MVQTPDLSIVKVVQDVDGDTTDPVVDAAGDVINYRITVDNTGNVTLTGITVTDTLDPTVTAVLDGGFNIGDLDDDGNLDTNETWTYSASYMVTPGRPSTPAATSMPPTRARDVRPASATLRPRIATRPGPRATTRRFRWCRAADLSIVKVVQDVDGYTTDPVVDAAGDVINYTITVDNTGN